jgi:hypothetical protein
MHAAPSAPASERRRQAALLALTAAARVSCHTEMTSVVVVPRARATVTLAREIAERFGVEVAAAIAADGIEIRFGRHLHPEHHPSLRAPA